MRVLLQPFLFRLVLAALMVVGFTCIGTPINLHAANGNTFQQNAIQGKVIDETGIVLRGVTIRVKGTNRGAVTDKEGKFSIMANQNEVLVFSLIGYGKKEVTVGASTTLDITMPSDIQRLEDVVVVGYGSQIKKDVTGNIAKVKASEITDIPVPSFDVALQGKAAGVVVTQGSGKLGQGVQIRVRGASSISASQDPLYVLDGVPLTPGGGFGTFGGNVGRSVNPLADLNFQDVESIDILKDAAAASIYGSRGANGVVIITTKKGKAGKTSINVSFQKGFSSPSKKLEFLNTQQYVDYFLQAAGNSDKIESIDPKDPDSYTSYMESFFVDQAVGQFKRNDIAGSPNTNWGDAVLRSDAPTTQLDFNINGGNEKTLFFGSGQYFEQEGIIVGNKLTRFSGRLNVDHKVSDVFKVGFNMSLARTLNERLPGDNAFSSPLQAVALPPMTPLSDPATGLPVGTPPGDVNIPLYYNPLIGIDNSYRKFVVLRNIGNFFSELNITEGLNLRGQMGFDIATQNEEQWFGSKTRRNSGYPLGGVINLAQRVENLSGGLFLNYATSFDVHTIEATVGTEVQRSLTKTTSLTAQDLPSDAFRLANAAAKPTGADAQETEFTFLSYFARANYKFNEFILASVSARIDGSSRFGANQRYGFFPAASLGVVLSSMDFLKDNEVVSFLKVRGSFGSTGNAEIGNFAARALVSGTAAYGGQPGTRPLQLPNADLTWETTQQLDIGVDFGFFNNRITGEIDYYSKNTTGLLLNVNVPASTGFLTQVRNVGELQNSGIEVVLNTDNVVTDDFSWKTSINFSANTNKVTNLQGQILQGGIGDVPSRAMEGQPIGVFFTQEYAGVDPANGNALWYKNTTNPDGSLDRTTTSVYNQAQRVISGNPAPKWSGGMTNTLSYSGIELSFQFNAVMGNKTNFYGVGRYSSANGRFEDNQTVDQLNSWRPDNTNTDIPQARLFYNNGAQGSSRFIYDGSFIRLRTATLAYNLPKSLISDFKLNSLRVYVTGFNLLTFTNYKGWDPEVNSDDFVGNIGQGVDFYTAPQARTIMFGINVGF